MIPPTSIDGTDIIGATIDGTNVTEITVDGDTVFTAGPEAIDTFESGNLNNWTAYNNPDFVGIESNTVKVGNFAVNLERGVLRAQEPDVRTPVPGDIHGVWVQPRNGNDLPMIGWGADATLSGATGYLMFIRADNNQFEIDGPSISNPTVSVTIDAGEWYLMVVKHDANGDIDARLYDDTGTNQIQSITANDSSLITGGQFDNPYVHMNASRSGGFWDHWVYFDSFP